MTITKTGIQALDSAVASVYEPIQRFIDTGIFEEINMLSHKWEDPTVIGHCQVRRVARQVARELKRPFITMESVYHNYSWNHQHQKWQRMKEPKFFHVYMTIPKRKYLAPIYNPLLLTEGNTEIVSITGSRTLQINIKCLEFYKAYRESLDRPEMRAARKLPPL